MFGKLFQTILFILFCAGFAPAQDTLSFTVPLESKSLNFGLESNSVSGLPKIALALSGGGARSMAQLGILKAFEENNIQVDFIAGTSMGSIIGGLYAAGYSVDELDSIFVNTDWNIFTLKQSSSRRELYVEQKITEDRALFALRLDGFKPILPNSFISGQQTTSFLNLLALNAPLNLQKSFDKLLIDFSAVCTDLVSGNAYVFNKGSLSLAMRASSSVTLLLPPVKKDSILLVDGGLVANIPTEILKKKKPDLLFAVNSTSPLKRKGQLYTPLNYADQILSIPMRKLNNEHLNLADFVMTPIRDSIKNDDFGKTREIIDLGYEFAQSKMDSIELMIGKNLERRSSEYFPFKEYLPFDDSSAEEKIFAERLNGHSSVNKEIAFYELSKSINAGDYSNVKFSIIPEGNTGRVILNLTPNPAVKNISVAGCGVFPVKNLNALFEPLIGKPYNGWKIQNLCLDILREYRKLGYSLAEIENVRFDAEGNLKIILSEGQINSVEVEGNKKTNREVITRELPAREGDLFKYGVIEQTLNNLRSSNLFESIELRIEKESGKNKIIIGVEEKPSSIFRFGLRFDNEYLLQMAVDIRDENLFGTATELGAVFAGGLRNRSVYVEHKANRIFNTYLTYKLKGFYQFNDVKTYKYEESSEKHLITSEKSGEYRQIFYGASLGVGTQVEKFGNVIFESKFHINEIKNTLDSVTEEYRMKLFSFKLGFSIDSQNRYPFPTSGAVINAYYETAQKILGGELAYSKFLVNYKSFFPFGNSVSINPRFEFGFADETLPLSQQFSLGGQYSFFGYNEHEFRGRQIFIASLETRYKLPFKLFFDAYLKFRYDLGSTWASREQIRFKDLKHGLGLSLSLDTPVGPAEFAVGRSFLFRNILEKNQIYRGPVAFYFRIGYYY